MKTNITIAILLLVITSSVSVNGQNTEVYIPGGHGAIRGAGNSNVGVGEVHKIGKKVEIGTASPSALLSFAGNMDAREIIVEITSGDAPDYVFADDYELSTLVETASYIEENLTYQKSLLPRKWKPMG